MIATTVGILGMTGALETTTIRRGRAMEDIEATGGTTVVETIGVFVKRMELLSGRRITQLKARTLLQRGAVFTREYPLSRSPRTNLGGVCGARLYQH